MLAGEPPEEIKTDPLYGKAPITVLGNGGGLSDKYDLTGVPHTFYFNRSGRVVLDIDGYSESYLKQLESRLEADLGKAQSASAQ